jgi:hypothetical protein
VVSSLLIIYVYTRYNLIPSIHSFLSETSFLQYDYLVHIILKVYLFTILYVSIYRFRATSYPFLKLYKYYLLYEMFKVISLSIVLTLVITVGFNSLGVFSIKALQYLTTLLVATLLFINMKPNTIYFSVLFINPLCITIYVLIYRFFIMWRILSVTHLLVFLLLMISLLS